MKLPGKVVVITGAANGLGKALAQEFSRHSAQVVAVDIDRLGLAALQNELPDITTIRADITDSVALGSVLEDTLKIHSQLDIWINNAGIYGPGAPLIEQTMTNIRQVFAVNTLALIDGSILAANYFEAHPGGWIINVMSSTALGHYFDQGVYAASKFGARGFTLALAHHQKSTRVLGVYPDGIKTELFGKDQPPQYGQFLEPAAVAQSIIMKIRADDTRDLVIKR